MAISSQQVLEDLMRVLGDIDALVKTQANASPGDGTSKSDSELQNQLSAIRARANGVKDAIAHELHREARSVDSYLRANTWKTVGAAAALAFVAGALLGRPSRR